MFLSLRPYDVADALQRNWPHLTLQWLHIQSFRAIPEPKTQAEATSFCVEIPGLGLDLASFGFI